MKLKFGSQLIETHFESEWIHSVYLGNVKAGILLWKKDTLVKVLIQLV